MQNVSNPYQIEEPAKNGTCTVLTTFQCIGSFTERENSTSLLPEPNVVTESQTASRHDHTPMRQDSRRSLYLISPTSQKCLQLSIGGQLLPYTANGVIFRPDLGEPAIHTAFYKELVANNKSCSKHGKRIKNWMQRVGEKQANTTLQQN